jgi:hypothetical protein
MIILIQTNEFIVQILLPVMDQNKNKEEKFIFRIPTFSLLFSLPVPNPSAVIYLFMQCTEPREVLAFPR